MHYSEIRYNTDYSPEELRWNGWGAVSHEWKHAAALPELRRMLGDLLGAAGELPQTPCIALDELKLPASRLKPADLKALSGIVGAGHCHVDRRMRVQHSHGQSYADLIRLRTNQLKRWTDAVVFPENEGQLKRLFAWSRKSRVALVPFGGGSSVVGGVDAKRGNRQRAVVTVNLTRMNALLDINEESRLARFQAGIFGPQIEAALNQRGFTLGHFPQSFEHSTLGGWIAARSGGQQSNQYGKIEKILNAVRLISPAGVLETIRVPAQAAGPDWNQIIAGSEGSLGIITEATVKIHRLPETRRYFAMFFPSFEQGIQFVREVSAKNAPYGLSMVRLSDAEETGMLGLLSRATAKRSLLRPVKATLQEGLLTLNGQPQKQRCVVISGMEGEVDRMNRQELRLRKAIRRFGGMYAGEGAGKSWLRGRFELPYLRDHLLDCGVGVDTLETAVDYARIPETHSAVLSAIRAADPHIEAFCHMSHSYHDGACLYFSFFFLIDPANPIKQWERIKRAASDALLKGGAALSHHHGIGSDHLAHLQKQQGPLARAGLQALKASFDPDGTLNPGKLMS